MRIKEFQDKIKALIHRAKRGENLGIFGDYINELIEDAKVIAIDLLGDKDYRKKVLEAVFQTTLIASLLSIDVEYEINKLFRGLILLGSEGS